jgi:hypothetical protein
MIKKLESTLYKLFYTSELMLAELKQEMMHLITAITSKRPIRKKKARYFYSSSFTSGFVKSLK